MRRQCRAGGCHLVSCPPGWTSRRAQGFRQRGSSSEGDQNDSVPLNVIMSTSCSPGCSRAQLPSGLRGASPCPLTVLVKLPIAAVNCPVPPVTSPVCCSVSLNRQLRGFRENEVICPAPLTRC